MPLRDTMPSFLRATLALAALGVVDGCGPRTTSPRLDAGDEADGGDAPRDANSDARAAFPPLVLADLDAPLLLSRTFRFAEGPVWDPGTGTLLFSDIDADTIYRVTLPGTVAAYRSPSHRANGLGLDGDGQLLAAEHASRSVTRTLADGTRATLAGSWEGVPLNSPNDLIVRSDGVIYFSDPTFGLGSAPSALGFTGLYRIDSAGGLHLEAAVDGQPNGVALSPDEHTLYVAATTSNRLLTFSVGADGALADARPFADVDAPDGLAVDRAGNVYVAALASGRGAVKVFTSSGAALGTIPLAEQPTNCAFGGDDGKTLFITARTALYSLSVPIPGT